MYLDNLLSDDPYPTSHFNPAATDSVLHRAASTGKQLQRNKDVKVVRNLMVSNPTVKKIGTDTVAFAERYARHPEDPATYGQGVSSLAFTPYPGFEEQARKADVTARRGRAGRGRRARRAQDDAKLLTAIGGMERLGVTFETGINGVYNLFDRDGFHYCVYGGTKVLKTTDDNVVRGPVRVVKSVDVAAALPREAAKAVTRIIGLNMTYDGYIAAAAPGALVVLDRDLNVRSLTSPSPTRRSTTASRSTSTTASTS